METRAGTDYISLEMANRDLKAFVESHERLFVLTGAGCSTNSGIPDYRDADGSWKRTQRVSSRRSSRTTPSRSRYWARSMIGWRRFKHLLPNDTHHALARLEANGRSRMLLTQNVDRLHQAAGSRVVIDLHGRLDLVRCMACSAALRRADFQEDLVRLNASWADGNAELDHLHFSGFAVPHCPSCGGVLKPDVVSRRKHSAGIRSPWPWRLWSRPTRCWSWVRPVWSIRGSGSLRRQQGAVFRSRPSISAGHAQSILLTLKVQDRCEAASLRFYCRPGWLPLADRSATLQGPPALSAKVEFKQCQNLGRAQLSHESVTDHSTRTQQGRVERGQPHSVKGRRSMLWAAPSVISSATAPPVAGALRMPQTLWPVATSIPGLGPTNQGQAVLCDGTVTCLPRDDPLCAENR